MRKASRCGDKQPIKMIVYAATQKRNSGRNQPTGENGCSCSDWSSVMVKNGFDPRYVRDTQFSGKVELGVF